MCLIFHDTGTNHRSPHAEDACVHIPQTCMHSAMQYYITVGEQLLPQHTMIFFLSTINAPSFFFALICWQHWNEKYLSLQQQEKHVNFVRYWNTRGLRNGPSEVSQSIALAGTFDHAHYDPSLEFHSCYEHMLSPPAGSSRHTYNCHYA